MQENARNQDYSRRLRENKGNISFIDFDDVLHEKMFRDGVLPNNKGYGKIGRRLHEWPRARLMKVVWEE